VSIQWSGLGPELLLRLDRALDESVGSQLERQLRDAIRSGRLTPGERLPSSRVLARELGLSRGVVQECYSQLLAEGFLSARTGSGTSVATAAIEEASAAVDVERPVAGPRIDFRYGRADVASFPRRDWMWAMREVSRTAAATEFEYGDPRGRPHVRAVLAAYLRRVRGAMADPQRIVVCAGYAQGLNLVLRVLARGGTSRVAVEDPGHPETRETLEYLGFDAIPVNVDEHGLDVEELTASGAEAVIMTPAHQAPMGVVLAPRRRQALVEWADAHDATIIEDDYDSEFRYDRDPVGALQGLAPNRVALIGTVSKSLSPSLRLGWIVCPSRLLDSIAEAKFREDRGSSGLDQLALAALIESGRFDKHLRRMRAVYAKRRRALVDAFAEYAPEVQLQGLAAGIHAVGRLPDGLDEPTVVEGARQRSVGLPPMSRWRASGQTRPPRLVLGFGDLSESAINHGIKTVADLLRAP
jgi:GntR family transcriptional regulator / MocR family aminotransferase